MKSLFSKSLADVGNDVIYIFDSHGKSNKIGCNTRFNKLFIG